MKKLIITLTLFSSFAYGQTLTLAQWKRLSPAQKSEHFYKMQSSVYVRLTAKGYVFPKGQKTTPGMEKLIAAYYVKYLNTELELDDEVHDDMYGVVGAPVYTMDFYFSKDYKILAVELNIFQQGCSHLDKDGEFIDQFAHYATEKEANKNGCVDNDVSWNGWSRRDENAREFDTNGYMEWTGH